MEQTDTLKNGYKIIQDTERFQFGIDAVLLADFAAREVRAGDKVIDLGTGTGIIPLLMEGRSRSAEARWLSGAVAERSRRGETSGGKRPACPFYRSGGSEGFGGDGGEERGAECFGKPD